MLGGEDDGLFVVGWEGYCWVLFMVMVIGNG